MKTFSAILSSCAFLSLFMIVSAMLFAAPEGEGIPFDGKTGYRIDAGKFEIKPDNFSVSVWVRLKETPKKDGAMQTFISLGSTLLDGFKLYDNHSVMPAIRLQVETKPDTKIAVNSSYFVASVPSPEGGQWTHYTGTYNGKTITVYENGEKKNEKNAVTSRASFDSGTLSIGAIPNAGHYLTGSLDDIQLWNKTLSAEEVKQVFNGQEVKESILGTWNSKGKTKNGITNSVQGQPDAVIFNKGTYSETANPSPITIDGKPLDSFDKNITEYTCYLPSTDTPLPKVSPASSADVIEQKEKSVSVKLKDKDGEKEYRIKFEVLPKLDLFLCIGQSNMAGRGTMYKEKGDLEPIPNVYLFTPSGNWEPARNPLNRYSNIRKDLSMQQICPAYGFAQKLSAQIKRPIGLIVNAKGGTTIEQWTKGSPDGFSESSLVRAKDAMQWGTFKGILWHQGEGNSGRPDTYPEQLKKLAEHLRSELGGKSDGEKLFFVAGELGQWHKNYERFNKMISGISSFLNDSGCATTENLKPLRGDVSDPHFDRESQIILGNRYADIILREVYEK